MSTKLLDSVIEYEKILLLLLLFLNFELQKFN
jgi:hypothetical protein